LGYGPDEWPDYEQLILEDIARIKIEEEQRLERARVKKEQEKLKKERAKLKKEVEECLKYLRLRHLPLKRLFQSFSAEELQTLIPGLPLKKPVMLDNSNFDDLILVQKEANIHTAQEREKYLLAQEEKRIREEHQAKLRLEYEEREKIFRQQQREEAISAQIFQQQLFEQQQREELLRRQQRQEAIRAQIIRQLQIAQQEREERIRKQQREMANRAQIQLKEQQLLCQQFEERIRLEKFQKEQQFKKQQIPYYDQQPIGTGTSLADRWWMEYLQQISKAKVLLESERVKRLNETNRLPQVQNVRSKFFS
jgi:hypothetical protein